MRMQRATPKLRGRSNDLATVLRQDVDRVLINIAEDQVLRATSQDRYPVSFFAGGWRHGRNQIVRKVRLDGRRHPLQLAKPFREQLQNPASANQARQPKPLVQPQDSSDQLQTGVPHEQPTQSKIPNQTALWRRDQPLVLSLGAGLLE